MRAGDAIFANAYKLAVSIKICSRVIGFFHNLIFQNRPSLLVIRVMHCANFLNTVTVYFVCHPRCACSHTIPIHLLPFFQQCNHGVSLLHLRFVIVLFVIQLFCMQMINSGTLDFMSIIVSESIRLITY